MDDYLNGDIDQGPQLGAHLPGAWRPGDRFRLADRGDRYDGVEGSVRSVYATRAAGEQVHVTHDDGTYTTWPAARLERPATPSTPGGAVTKPNPAPPAGTTPSLVQLDRNEAAHAVAEAAAEFVRLDLQRIEDGLDVAGQDRWEELRLGLHDAVRDYRAAGAQ
ncbi:hypothetical protein ACFQHV_01160 [Promicromonospora thailandica]|uniref:Uncharacterized protein n=1 Tax=Promicromonospora thailandica TaxID=765201 RepID=A0A9X2G1W7_9MICO|nr:hypothetical protein [Promicromonospora thailandica]MCP2265537.1 hypothetical protein [Promicromonospora thailandica]BFF17103.1 hypothetical protein GCM10025730_06240 [Promicromonospora thailandica]